MRINGKSMKEKIMREAIKKLNEIDDKKKRKKNYQKIIRKIKRE